MKQQDRDKLEQAADISFHNDSEAEAMVEIVRAWDEARDAPISEPLKKLLKLRKQAELLGATVVPTTSLELLQHDDTGLGLPKLWTGDEPHKVTDRQWPQYQRRVAVAMVAGIWRGLGGKGTGSIYDYNNECHDGPMIRLMRELFEQAGIPKERWPSPHSLHDDLLATSA